MLDALDALSRPSASPVSFSRGMQEREGIYHPPQPSCTGGVGGCG